MTNNVARQLGAFDTPPPPPPPTKPVPAPVSEIEARRQSRRGQQIAAEAAGEAWARDCDKLLGHYLRTHPEFFGADWWPWAIARGLEKRGRALGPRLKAAARAGHVTQLGYRPDPNHHQRPATVWKSNLYTPGTEGAPAQ